MSQTSPYYVYIVECSDDTYYTGIALNLKLRLDQHNGLLEGGGKYTRSRRPVALVYAEKSNSKSDALKREYEIKSFSREQKKRLIENMSKDKLLHVV